MDVVIIMILLLGTVSILSSVYTLFSIYFFGAKTDSTKLMVVLHIAQIIDATAGLPNITPLIGERGHSHACRIATSFRVFGVLLQVTVSFFMVLLVRRILFHKDTDTLNPQRFKLPMYGWVIICIMPVITFGSLAEKPHVYDYNNSFCTYTGWTNNIVFLLAPLTLLVLLMTYQGVMLVKEVRRETNDVSIFYRLLRGLGGYFLATYFCVVPRVIMRFIGIWDVAADHSSIIGMEYAYEFILYFNGLMYTYVFLLEKEKFKEFEHDNALIYEDYDQRLSELMGNLSRISSLEISNIIHSSGVSDMDEITKANTARNTLGNNEIVI